MIPFVSRYRRNRGKGSRASHALTSASSRYFVGSSAVVWSDSRYVRASISVGPSPRRARSTASRVAT